MKGELIILKKEEYDDDIWNISYSSYDFCITLCIEQKNELKEYLSKKEEIIKAIDEHIDIMSTELDLNEINSLKELKQNVDNLFDYIEYIVFYHDDFDVIKFIEENTIIKNKKIVIPGRIEIDEYDRVKYLMIKYKKYKDNIYVKMDNNMGYVSLNDCLNTINKIREQADKILSLNLSPMETIMYTYDQVRNRVYKNESIGDSALKSRDLTSVLNNEEIVCVGFSNIFQALLHYMNINCFNAGLSSRIEGENGHERNVIYIQDEKYGIDGIYYFDATWDNKKENETNEFLYRYKFFAKTRKQMVEIERDYYEYRNCECYSDDMVSDVKRALEEGETTKTIKIFKTINYIGNLIDGKHLLTIDQLIPVSPNYNNFDKKELLIKFADYENKYNNPISAETYIKLLNNVRKIEHSENPEFYPYTINDLYKTFIKSRWTFNKHHYDESERLLLMIFGKGSDNIKNNTNNPKNDFINFIVNENICTEIKEEQTAKLLKKVK